MAAKPNTTRTVTLSQPIVRGSGEKQQTIESVELRKPNAGELRGVKLLDLIQMDVGAVITVTPRISEPALTEAELNAMDPGDITDIAVELHNFLDKGQSRNR